MSSRRAVALLHGTQRAVHLDDAARVAVGEVHRAAGGADVQLHRADRRCPVAAVADLERLEAPGQALEVAGGAGRELPVEVERQGDLVLAGPRRAERLRRRAASARGRAARRHRTPARGRRTSARPPAAAAGTTGATRDDRGRSAAPPAACGPEPSATSSCVWAHAHDPVRSPSSPPAPLSIRSWGSGAPAGTRSTRPAGPRRRRAPATAATGPERRPPPG